MIHQKPKDRHIEKEEEVAKTVPGLVVCAELVLVVLKTSC